MAAPTAAPRIACSEIGVSRTRTGSSPQESPTVALTPPPAFPNVLAQEHDVGIARHFPGNAAGNRIAIGQFRHAKPPSA